jgi:hypothetical protein
LTITIGIGRGQAEGAHERLRFAAGGAVADGDGLDLEKLHEAEDLLLRLLGMAVGKDDVVVQQLALAIEEHGLAAGAEAGVDRQHDLLPERRGEQQLAHVVGEDPDRGLVGALLRLQPHLGFQGGREQALAGILHGEDDMIGAGLRGGGGGRDGPLDEERLHGGEGRAVVGQLHAHHQEELLLAAAHGEHAVRRGPGERLAPLEVVLVLRGLGIGVLAGDHPGGDHGVLLEQRAQAGAGILVVAHALGEDVAGAGEGFLGRGDLGFLVLPVVGDVFAAHVRLRGGERHGGGILGEEEVGERLETLLLRDGGAGALLGPEGEVNVLQGGDAVGGEDGLFECRGEQGTLLERGEDGGAAFVDGAELLQPVADGEHLHLVEFAGDLLAVARDERHRRALGEQLRRGGDLEDLHVELGREAEHVIGIGLGGRGGGGRSDGGGHAKESRRAHRGTRAAQRGKCRAAHFAGLSLRGPRVAGRASPGESRFRRSRPRPRDSAGRNRKAGKRGRSDLPGLPDLPVQDLTQGIGPPATSGARAFALKRAAITVRGCKFRAGGSCS